MLRCYFLVRMRPVCDSTDIARVQRTRAGRETPPEEDLDDTGPRGAMTIRASEGRSAAVDDIYGCWKPGRYLTGDRGPHGRSQGRSAASAQGFRPACRRSGSEGSRRLGWTLLAERTCSGRRQECRKAYARTASEHLTSFLTRGVTIMQIACVGRVHDGPRNRSYDEMDPVPSATGPTVSSCITASMHLWQCPTPGSAWDQTICWGRVGNSAKCGKMRHRSWCT